MKAAIYTQYGPPEVLHIAELPQPVPKPNQVLIKVVATTVTAADWRLRKADPFLARLFNGLWRPRRVNILGFELSGDVVAVGSAVTRFKVGDAVLAACGLGFGGYAEYKCLAEDALIVRKPHNISYEEAAAVPIGAATAVRFLRKGKIRRGQNILIYGASGSVGTYAVQLARHHGANVTAVCSTANLAMVKALGAEHVIDYTSEDFAERGERYDTIYDAVYKAAPAQCRKALAPGGRFLSIHQLAASERADDLVFLAALLANGELKPVIDRCYALEQIVEAHRYVEAGHKKGNVVVRIGAGA